VKPKLVSGMEFVFNRRLGWLAGIIASGAELTDCNQPEVGYALRSFFTEEPIKQIIYVTASQSPRGVHLGRQAQCPQAF
jgi:hypothetical protein